MRADIIPTQEGDEETLPAHPVLPQRSQKGQYTWLVSLTLGVKTWAKGYGSIQTSRVYTMSHI